MNCSILDEAPTWHLMLRRTFIERQEKAYLDYLDRQKTGGVIA